MNPITLALVLAAAGVSAGCASSTPQYDARFGDAVRQARLAQTLNPAAGHAMTAAPTMEGRTAREVSERYQESFKTPPPVVNVINIGGAVGGR
jgi:hypothetical protein